MSTPPPPYVLATIGQVQPHQAVVGLQQGCVGCKVGRRPRVGLNVNAPAGRIQVERLQSPLLAQQLDLVHHLGPPIVPGGEAKVVTGVPTPPSAPQPPTLPH